MRQLSLFPLNFISQAVSGLASEYNKYIAFVCVCLVESEKRKNNYVKQ